MLSQIGKPLCYYYYYYYYYYYRKKRFRWRNVKDCKDTLQTLKTVTKRECDAKWEQSWLPGPMGLTHYHSARAHGADIFVSPMGLNVMLNLRHPQGCDNFVIPMGLKMRLNSCHPHGCDNIVSPSGLKMRLNSCHPRGCDNFVSPTGLKTRLN